MMKRFTTTLLAGMLLFAGLAEVGRAQSYSHTARAFVQSPQALGMGDTGVAFSSRETVFFYNPAHLARVATIRPRIDILGVRASLSSNFFDQIAFYDETLQPAIDEGLDQKSAEELEDLYNETLAMGRQRTLLNGDILLPSTMVSVNGIGVGGGIFGHSVLHYRFEDAGAGVPAVDLNALGDIMVIGAAGTDLSAYGVRGLSVGLTGKWTQRWLTVKKKSLDQVSENEAVYILKGSSLGFDVGFLYDVDVPTLPGNVTLGFAAYDLIGGGFDYRYSTNLTDKDAEDPAAIAAEEDHANEVYAVHPSFRIGAAYMLPTVRAVGLLKNTGVTIDYMWFAEPILDQAFLAGLHVGAQAQLSVLVLRLGLNQGYTTIGGGIDAGFVTLDYAYYGVEQGRYPGQLASWNHTVQLRFGL